MLVRFRKPEYQGKPEQVVYIREHTINTVSETGDRNASWVNHLEGNAVRSTRVIGSPDDVVNHIAASWQPVAVDSVPPVDTDTPPWTDEEINNAK